MTDSNFLLTISLHYHEMRLWELIKWSPKRKYFDLLSNSLNSFFKEMYRDQFGEFVLQWCQTRLILCFLCFLILTIIIQNHECKLRVGGNENKVPGNNKDIFVSFFPVSWAPKFSMKICRRWTTVLISYWV